eukprot:13239559-Ditylum_brightwellii.AAC.1
MHGATYGLYGTAATEYDVNIGKSDEEGAARFGGVGEAEYWWDCDQTGPKLQTGPLLAGLTPGILPFLH